MMKFEPAAEETFNKIYQLLIDKLGAAEVDRDDFVRSFATGGTIEWRFCGALGFGGKFYRNAGRYYVQCYREDETPARTLLIETTNAVLDLFEYHAA